MVVSAFNGANYGMNFNGFAKGQAKFVLPLGADVVDHERRLVLQPSVELFVVPAAPFELVVDERTRIPIVRELTIGRAPGNAVQLDDGTWQWRWARHRQGSHQLNRTALVVPQHPPFARRDAAALVDDPPPPSAGPVGGRAGRLPASPG